MYLTRFIGGCLKLLEACPTPAEGKLAVQRVALGPVILPCERGFALEGLFTAANSRSESDALRAWLAQAHAEVSLRLLQLFYTPRGGQNALWLSVAKRSRKFFTVYGTYTAPVEEEVVYKRNATASRSIEVHAPHHAVA